MKLWVLYALFSAMFAALVAILGKIGMARVDSTLATTLRSIVMAVFLSGAALALGKFSAVSELSARGMLFIVLAGVAGALSWLFYFMALKKGPAVGVAALDRLSVVFVVIFAAMFLSEKLNLKTGVGAALMTAGAILMAWK